jgi:hypothetical protein
MKLIDLKQSRFIAGAPGDVFDVWFDLASPGGPWHGAKKAMMNLAVDGMFYFAIDRAQVRAKSPGVAATDGPVGTFGRFTLVQRPHAAEHTWMSELTYGLETTVSVTFEARDGGTQLTVVHRGLPDDEIGRRHENGWTAIVARVERHFGARG